MSQQRIKYCMNILKVHCVMSYLWEFEPIDHFTIVCLVTWSLNESEAGLDVASNRNLTAFLM